MSATYRTKSNANRREAPTTASKILDVIKHPARVIVLNLQQGEEVQGENLWAAVESGGFIHLGALAFVEDRKANPGDELAYQDSKIYNLREELAREIQIRAALSETKAP